MKKAQRAAAGCAAQKLAVGKFVNDDPLVGGKEMMQRGDGEDNLSDGVDGEGGLGAMKVSRAGYVRAARLALGRWGCAALCLQRNENKALVETLRQWLHLEIVVTIDGSFRILLGNAPEPALLPLRVWVLGHHGVV
eukprot:scaffold122_cov217-Skeletonema_menzelii.AAC.1